MHQDSKRTYTAIVLFIKPFVWCCSRHSWFAKTPYCSVRDWTRFLRHRIKKYPDSPVHTLSDSLRIYFFPLWRADLFFSGFAVEFAGYVWTVAVSGKKVADSKISGYVWTGPKRARTLFVTERDFFGSTAGHVNDPREAT